MKKIVSAIALCLCCLQAAFADAPYSKLYENLPVELQQPAMPSIPELRVSLTEYGAKGDGLILCTEAFSNAIEALSGKGGGHLDVPAGVWLTGPIVLKSKIDLHLAQGAIVIFTPDKSAYMANGLEGGRVQPCISANKCSDISITGSGVLDGNGKYWRYAKREKLSDTEWKDLLSLGGTLSDDGKLWFPYNLKHISNVTQDMKKEEAVRQHMISLKRCKKVLLQGVTIQNSPKFHVVPSQCTDVTLDGLTVRCPWNAQNGDGIDIGNSQRVLVTGCKVDVGDDGICMKGGSGAKGVKAGVCSDILICGNTVFHAHGGFVIGSDVSGGMQKIVVKDCVFSGTDTGLRFKSALGRGGHCEQIFISGITMNDIREAAITFSCDYQNITYKADDASDQVKEYAPDFGGISISNVVCRECRVGVYASGIKGLNCMHDITISNSTFFCTKKESSIDPDTASICLEGVTFKSL